MLYVSKDGYYKLPGGGFEGSENSTLALKRECREEIGCEIEILNELGVVTEYRKKYSLKQISYCFLAKVIGEKKPPEFDAGEIENGFEIVWMKVSAAKVALEKSDLHSYKEGIYIIPRDSAILKEAIPLLKAFGI